MEYEVPSKAAYVKQPFRCVEKKLQERWTPWRGHQQMPKCIREKT